MKIQAKFVCQSVKKLVQGCEIEMAAVSDKNGVNAAFTQYTPSGQFKMFVQGGCAAETYFEPGKNYVFDITEEKIAE